MNNTDYKKVGELIADAQKVVILQADNPDADSLGSALALEQIIGDMNKEPYLYCSVDMPSYLRYLEGWDRVSNELPNQFDLSIIVDASTSTLFEKLIQSGKQGWVAKKPAIVLDHHGEVSNNIEFATVTINNPEISSTGELIYTLATDQKWDISNTAAEFLMTAILGDTQGLTNALASSKTYRVIADIIDMGISRTKLEELRREFSKMPKIIYKYKGELIHRTELHNNGTIAIVDIPQTEINEFSPLYNPAPLIQNDMLQIKDVAISIVLKHYDDGKVTGAIRCNQGYGIGAELAAHFGGGGHPNASGFKSIQSRPFNELKTECITVATDLLRKLETSQ